MTMLPANTDLAGTALLIRDVFLHRLYQWAAGLLVIS